MLICAMLALAALPAGAHAATFTVDSVADRGQRRPR
jgi:hypothetical protein